jgi:hypothetical protein
VGEGIAQHCGHKQGIGKPFLVSGFDHVHQRGIEAVAAAGVAAEVGGEVGADGVEVEGHDLFSKMLKIMLVLL